MDQQELERANRIKDELISELSHELRAPLHAILGWSEVLLARVDLGAEDRRALEAIVRNARVQARVIDDGVELNRVISGKLRLDRRRTELVSVIAMAIELARPAADAKNLQLVQRLDGLGGSCDADPERLQQILGAALAHGIKAAPVNGEVAVATRRNGGELELSVSAGSASRNELTPAALEAAVPLGRRERHGGVSLGLALARSLAELHGGSLRLERARDASDDAVALVLRLPLQVPAIAPEPATAEAVPAVTHGARGDLWLDGLKVLVVDDDRDARDLVQLILTEAHARAVTAASADEGLTILRELKPDLIISDIGMAMRDGYQFMRLVRTMPSDDGGATPALALTAFVQTEDRTRALLAGYQEHISKPVEARQLIAAVHRLARGADAHA